ncbi:MAG: heme-copper oxidase subunit III [Saprospiraceae bacterium]
MNVSVSNDYRRSKIHPQKFALYAACASISMMFVALTSAWIVRQAAGNWLEFRLPDIFLINTAVIILSSITLHASYNAFKKGNTTIYKGGLVVTAVLGLAFLIGQYFGWMELRNIGIDLVGNPSGSFVYVISALHAAHIIGGVAAVLIACLHAFILPHKVTPKRKLRFELTLTYWHFVDLLWVYLLVFMLFQ